MSDTLPKTTKRWVIRNFTGPSGLELEETPIPELGPHDVLVKLSAASLNYRDLVMARGKYPWPALPHPTPTSDGAGTVLATGSAVTTLSPGTLVATVMNGEHLSGPVQPRHLERVLGGSMEGALTQYGVYPEEYLIALPKGLGFVEGAALACAGVTGWDALYGLEGKEVKRGDWVLVLGTGGVGCWAVQFAKAAGATVIAITSSEEKAQRLRAIGADHVLNYKNEPNWGALVKDLTPNKEGVDLVVETSGASTVKQSLESIKWGGVISLVGFRGGEAKDVDEPKLLDMFFHFCIVRTCFVGPRVQYEAMNAAIEAHQIKPVIDDRVFDFSEAREAFTYMEELRHFGKVCIKID